MGSLLVDDGAAQYSDFARNGRIFLESAFFRERKSKCILIDSAASAAGYSCIVGCMNPLAARSALGIPQTAPAVTVLQISSRLQRVARRRSTTVAVGFPPERPSFKRLF